MPGTIRRATADDFDRIFHLARTAFPIQASDRDEMQRTFKPERNLVLEEDGRIVARALGVPMGHWFGGKPVPSLGVAGVTVSPEARGHGYGTRIVEALLADSTAPLSALYPATLPIYRTLGYGDAMHRTSYSADLSRLPTRPEPGIRIEELRAEQLPTLIETYERFAHGQSGVLARDATWWAERVLTDAHPFRYLAFRDDTCVGWIVYGFEKVKDDWRQDLVARDLVWCDLAAARALLGVASMHRSTCRKLRWTGPIDETLHEATYDHAVDLEHSFRAMLRLLDVPAALAARGYAPTVDAEATLHVLDPRRPGNEGPWRITVAKGVATVTPGDAAAASASVTVQGLASMYAGLLPARTALRLGSLGADRDTIHALEAIFAGPNPWLGDFF